MKITFLGQSSFLFETNNKKIIIDPFLKGNPSFNGDFDKITSDIDVILLTHCHEDHMGDCIDIYKKTNATIVCNFETGFYLEKLFNIKDCYGMNKGGTFELDDIKIRMVGATHSNSFEYNGELLCVGDCCGYVIKSEGHHIYHAGDTDIFADMQLIQELQKPTVGLLPVGGRFTMDCETALFACEKYFDFDKVIPMHCNTFPIIEADLSIMEKKLGEKFKIIKPNECLEL